ncbi:MAG: AAA family ATPase [Nitrosomonas sp.]|nr:AAA family ATPase [Nitrosomonas sp.]
MIENILIKKEASFDETGQHISDLKQINFLYGPNGSGKTTISRVINNQEQYPDCNLTWKAGTPIKTLVYNRDFITRNFNPDKEIAGIFTLGEHDASIAENINTAKKERDGIITKIEGKKKTLQGEDGNGGKSAELETLKEEFSEQCWTYKKKYEDIFKDAFKGDLTKEKFKTRLLKETENNNAALFSLEELKEKAKTVFADDLTKEESTPPILYNDLIALESTEILSKKVVGKDDVDIAAMIKKLGNSDWVKQGRTYYDQNDEYCPFCQQKTDSAFADSLEEYFNDAFLNDISAIETLSENYSTFSETILQRLDGLLSAKPTYLDCDKIQAHKDVFEARIRANKQHIARKKKEASTIVALETLQDVMDEIAAEITAANAKAKEHNATIDNLSKEKRTLISQIWRFIVEENKQAYDVYATKKNGLDTAIAILQSDIKNLEQEKKNKSDEIKEFERKITSIKPTIDEINKLLLSFGFSSFSLSESEKNGFYKIVRPNGEDVEETLSEGEKTFVTFLYFYHLLKGSNTESGITEDRIVVFDDPVSSLDSDILFIVSNLIKGLFEEVRSQTGHIKQIFVLTHNIYFHKEISFYKKRSNDTALKDETFWIIKKHNKFSTVERHENNPIKTSYELLWNEIRDQNRSSLTIQNVLRRIIENYFKILGGIDNNEIINKFDGQEKIICCSLMSWINDGSHFTNDDLYITCDDQTIDKYLEVFRSIFEKSNHLGHYNMMMGIVDDNHQTEKIAGNIQLQEASS